MIKLSQAQVSPVHRSTPTRPRRAASPDNTLLDQVLSTMPCGVGILDSNFRFVRVSSALAAIDGIPVMGHLGRTVDQDAELRPW